MEINNRFNIGDVVYIKTDVEQKPNIIICIKVYSDDFYTYNLNSPTDSNDYRDYEISKEEDKLIKVSNY
jgi:hypothetical protein